MNNGRPQPTIHPRLHIIPLLCHRCSPSPDRHQARRHHHRRSNGRYLRRLPRQQLRNNSNNQLLPLQSTSPQPGRWKSTRTTMTAVTTNPPPSRRVSATAPTGQEAAAHLLLQERLSQPWSSRPDSLNINSIHVHSLTKCLLMRSRVGNFFFVRCKGLQGFEKEYMREGETIVMGAPL